MLLQLFRFIGLTFIYLCGYFLTTIGKNKEERILKQGQWIYRYFLQMGPVYIKIGQILATRSDLIPENWVQILRELQDNVPSMSEADTRKIITKDLPLAFENVFSEFSFQPLASGSIAQVHSATLLTGQKVAVKVVKKNVRNQLKQNLDIIQFFVAILDFLVTSVRELGLPKRLQELRNLLIIQADMKQEAQKQEEVYNNFKNHPYVKVPAIIKDLSTSNLLFMEFMEGIPGKDVHKVELKRNLLAQRFQDTIYTMLYMHGLCHGDPHPGNIFFTKDGSIILLDYGITVQLSEDEKWGLSSFYYACTRKEWDVAVERFTQHFVTDKDYISQNLSQYAEEIQSVLQYHFDISTTQWSTVSYFQDVSKILRKYRARYTTNFTKVELVFLSCEGFASQIDPNIDIWENARKFTDRYSPYMNPEVKETFDAYFQKTAPSSLAMRDRANNSLVAPTHINRYFFPSTYPVFVKKADKSKIEDLDGNVFVDISCGYGPHLLGYAHPVINQAISEAIANGFVNAIGHEAELTLAEILVEALPGAEKAILSNSGTESILQAMRLCRAYRKKDRVAKFEGHYHGFSDQGMVSSWFRFTGEKFDPQPIAGTQGTDSATVKNTLVLQYGYIEGLERLRSEASELACVICEPMPSLLASYDVDFLTKLRAICTELDIPLIFDEVVSGFRVAYGGVQNLAGIIPDLTCLGKVIGGGLPCGAVVGKKKLIDIGKSSQDPFCDYEKKAFVGGTMSGNSITCLAGTAALTYLKEHPEIYVKLDNNTNWLGQKLLEIGRSHGVPIQVKANRSIFSLTFSHKSATYFREKQSGSNFKVNLALAYYMRKHGIYMPELHTLMLSAAHTQEDLELICTAFNLSLQEMLEDGFFTL
ncbi:MULTISPECIES: aminotransferase class III-fold pyridoxal phosphate-dependent enzyme [unclassified Nodularia (in: cyanobacteria)]|uniref:aminotransferase class III-fold pyridoxal phosphate-dependent enzyme n=1 Tax=unclassified Nodularia (in: cyanobacteria) TaxID=2656917 RepID=UPI0018816AF8|nr:MULTISPECIES: aminotransferase class III-fold pyridoxal phosphate-dependent enzyme [unclassified Nodularia (in: cyanobacteria)]MBE9201720.1 aminotransferase class III-fold pyridoxal phosphate-dependent enzyme [Nodularia sp. LEGE 06071]MCC2691251.1 aminotransferase class III-fold pyridoxal phosphate-dependent enzyme [Nodularia sp. LEGE 04288]QOV09184.1 NocF [Nodularia sp. LEGE 06071]